MIPLLIPLSARTAPNGPFLMQRLAPGERWGGERRGGVCVPRDTYTGAIPKPPLPSPPLHPAAPGPSVRFYPPHRANPSTNGLLFESETEKCTWRSNWRCQHWEQFCPNVPGFVIIRTKVSANARTWCNLAICRWTPGLAKELVSGRWTVPWHPAVPTGRRQLHTLLGLVYRELTSRKLLPDCTPHAQ